MATTKSKKNGKKVTAGLIQKKTRMPCDDEFPAIIKSKNGNGNYVLQCLKYNNSPFFHTSQFFNTKIEATKRMTRKNANKGVKGCVNVGDYVIAECDEDTINSLSSDDVLVVKFNHKYSDADVRFLKSKMGLHDPLNKDKSNDFNDEVYFEGDTDKKEKPKKIVSDDYMAGIDLPPCDDESDDECDVENTTEDIDFDDI